MGQMDFISSIFVRFFFQNYQGSISLIKRYVIVIPWIVRLYVEIIHELKRVDYLTYRWTNMV